MHKSSMLRMKWFVDNYASKIKEEKISILDVGSYDVNGSYKPLFVDKKYNYFGLDVERGPNVDIVLNSPYNWGHIETDSYDVIISGQAFEHMEFFWVVLIEMVRVLKKGGLMCIIAPNGFKEHRYPVDCYRFFSDGMAALARYTGLEILHIHTNSAPSRKNLRWYSQSCGDSMLVAKKNYGGAAKILNLDEYKCSPLDQKTFRSGMIPYDHLGGMILFFLWVKFSIIGLLGYLRTRLFPNTQKTVPKI